MKELTFEQMEVVNGGNLAGCVVMVAGAIGSLL